MIRIISGTFGMVKGKQVIPITKEYGPVQLEEELEKRLVNEGIAEYVGNAPVSADMHPKEDVSLPAYNAGMKLSELKKAAEAYGIETEGMTKAEILDAIQEAELEEDFGDNEAPPELSAEDVEDEA
nr:MAG TPA: HeH/LEM domain [Caudoviricetes sp.]